MSDSTLPSHGPQRPVTPSGLTPPLPREEDATILPDAAAAKPASHLPSVPGYELLGRLGRGGMGVVYKARQVGLKRLVALKMILAGSHAGPEELARFRMEAEAVAQLQHPHIVQIYEVGELDGLPYFSLEYVDGGSLAERLDGTPWPGRQAAALVETLARAIHYAHQHGIVHRDLKPANVLLQGKQSTDYTDYTDKTKSLSFSESVKSAESVDEWLPKITDFGLAKRLNTELGQTRTGAILGTPSYMAPEQAGGKSKQIGPTTDVYALGAVLYELLTGHPPHHAETPLDTVHQVLTEDPVPPRRLRPRIPVDLETICLKCLRKEQSARYPSALALASDLHRLLVDEPIEARPLSRLERGVKLIRRRPTASALTALAVVLLLSLAGTALWVWDAYYRVKVTYYVNVVTRRGVFEGVEPIGESQARHRQTSYKFYRRAGRVERVDTVNGHGQPTTFHDIEAFLSRDESSVSKRECRYDFRYNERGELTEQVASDRMGFVVWTFQYTTPTTGHFTDRRGFPAPRAGSNAAYVEFRWSDEGWPVLVRYLDRVGKRQALASGVAGERREFDARGLPVRITYLGLRDEPVLHRDGYASYTMAYDERANEIEDDLFDLAGQPTRDRLSNYASFKVGYDAVGNRVEWAYYGPDGRPSVCLPQGYARTTLRYDEHGDVVEWRCFGLDGQPMLDRTEGIALDRRDYDDQGNQTAEICFGINDEPVLHRQWGFHKRVMTYDANGNMLTWACFGLDGAPCLQKPNGYHRTAWTYDDRGNELSWCCYGLRGEPILDRLHGYHKRVLAYDDQGNEIERTVYSTDDRPILVKEGYARVLRRYDDRGNLISWACYGTDGKPVLHASSGYASVTYTYDERGNQTGEQYFGLDGRPLAPAQYGYAKVEMSYDDRGNEVEWACFGADGRPVASKKGGYAKVRIRYDDHNNEQDATYLDVPGKAVPVEVFLAEVEAGGEGERLGLKVGDQLVRFGGQPIQNQYQLRAIRRASRENGGPKPLVVRRASQEINVLIPGGPLGITPEDRAVAGR
jgi:serine/threonine protein kinase